MKEVDGIEGLEGIREAGTVSLECSGEFWPWTSCEGAKAKYPLIVW